MSEIRKYVPPEAEAFSKIEQGAKEVLSETGQSAIQGKEILPAATGIPVNRVGPDGNLITPEKTELYGSPDTTKEIEPGLGPNPSFSGPPDDQAGDNKSNKQDEKTTQTDD